MARFPGVDYLQFDSLLTEQELMVRQTARQFVDDRVLPLVREAFNKAEFPRTLIPEMAQLGFLGANLEGYGCAGMNNIEYGLIMAAQLCQCTRRTGDVPDLHLRV
jgi:glutaryl-CoA dehydrogenase